MKSQMKRDSYGLIFKPIDEVKKWNKKRIKAYKNRLHKYLSYIQQPEKQWELVFEKNVKTIPEDIEQLNRYVLLLVNVLKDKDE